MKTAPYHLFFLALANEARMSIIHSLRKGPKSVNEITKAVGLQQSHVSHHLKCLTFCGFVKNNREGKKRIYSLNEKTVNLLLKIADRHMERYAKQLRTCEVLEY
ncbi:MAG: ArsR/SmtB family transcription factor [Candidatus Bathyarchaeia archaeon]